MTRAQANLRPLIVKLLVWPLFLLLCERHPEESKSHPHQRRTHSSPSILASRSTINRWNSTLFAWTEASVIYSSNDSGHAVDAKDLQLVPFSAATATQSQITDLTKEIARSYFQPLPCSLQSNVRLRRYSRHWLSLICPCSRSGSYHL